MAFIPEYDHLFAMWIIAVFVILLLMPIVLIIRFPDNKEKAYRLTLTYQLYAFTFYFTFPLLKVLRGEVVYQLLLVGLFIGIFFLARFDQRTEVPIVFPDNNKDTKWISYVYYGIGILLVYSWFWRRLYQHKNIFYYIWRSHHDAVRFNHSISTFVLASFPVKFLGV